MHRVYDISLPIVDRGLRYPGDPEIRIRPHSAIANGDAANVSALQLGSHTGTHVDAPRHFIEGAAAVDELPLDRLVGPAIVVPIPEEVTAIGERELAPHRLEGHRRVLLKSRGSALLRRGGFVEDYPFLAPDGAELLVRLGVELVGIDYLSIERFGSEDFPTHRILLEREIVIVEGLDLLEVPPGEYELLCLPLRLAGRDGAPVRAILRA